MHVLNRIYRCLLNFWRNNTGAYIDVTKLLRGFMKKQKLNKDGIYLFEDNGDKVKVEYRGTIAPKLESGYCLELFDTVYILSIDEI